MKILSLLLSLMLITSCSHKLKKTESSFEFAEVQNLKVGISNLSEVEEKFGTPSEKILQSAQTTYRYSDSTGLERLIVRFGEDSKLLDVLWIPVERDFESSLSGAASKFKDANFKVQKEATSGHSVDSGGSFYIDKRMGVTIRYDQKSKAVEAIAIYGSNERKPADLNSN